MAVGDWAITVDGGGGADPLVHAAFQNSLVNPELPRPMDDEWCRRLNNDSGSARGHCVFLYNRAGETPVVGDDVSISMAMCLAPRTTVGEHSVGIGARLSSTIIAGPGNAPYMFSQDGYHLTITPGSPDYTVKLVKAVGGAVEDTLWSDTRVGVLDTYKWFHFRLDLLVQPNNDLKILVYENDLSTYGVAEVDPTGAQSWGAAIADIDIPMADAYDGAGGVGFGCQCKAGADYDVYIDRVVLQKG